MSAEKSKLKIYKNIIQYLLESSYFSLETIAEFSQTSLNTMEAIYYENILIHPFPEYNLVELYKMTIDIQNCLKRKMYN